MSLKVMEIHRIWGQVAEVYQGGLLAIAWAITQFQISEELFFQTVQKMKRNQRANLKPRPTANQKIMSVCNTLMSYVLIKNQATRNSIPNSSVSKETAANFLIQKQKVSITPQCSKHKHVETWVTFRFVSFPKTTCQCLSSPNSNFSLTLCAPTTTMSKMTKEFKTSSKIIKPSNKKRIPTTRRKWSCSSR